VADTIIGFAASGDQEKTPGSQIAIRATTEAFDYPDVARQEKRDTQ